MMSRGFSRAIDGRGRLIRNVQNEQCVEFIFVHASCNRIGAHGNDVVDVLRWVSKGLFPQTLWVAGPLPRAMVAFIDHTRKGYASALKGANVVTQIHQVSRIAGLSLEYGSQLFF